MKAIFLDRDGVICENRSDYVKSWREFEFLSSAKQSLATLNQLSYPIIVVTNQSAIGRGIISDEVVEKIHRHMVSEINAAGGRIDRIFYCPHQPSNHCNCRKPKSGLLQQAAAEMDIELAGSYIIGDAATDLIAGQQVGCLPVLVLTGRGEKQLPSALHQVQKFTITQNLAHAVQHILTLEQSLAPVSR